MSQLIQLGNIFTITSIIILIFGIINFETLKRFLPLRVLLFLIIISIISDIFGGIMQIRGIHNIWLMNLYSLIEYLMFALFYLVLFKWSNKNWKIGIILIFTTALGIMMITTIVQSFSEHLNSTLMGMKSIIFICCAGFYFKMMLDEIEYDTPWINPYFWINSAILIYFSGCFFIFIFSEYRGVTRILDLWDIHNIIHIIYNILILIGFWKARKV